MESKQYKERATRTSPVTTPSDKTKDVVERALDRVPKTFDQPGREKKG